MAEVLELCAQARELSDGWFDPWGLPGGLDPTGLVKGWAAQRALEALEAGGLAAGLINAGGDIATFGEPAARSNPGGWACVTPRAPIGCSVWSRSTVRAPWPPRGATSVASTSSPPAAGVPATALAAASVLGPELTFTDVLATALIASGGALLGRLSRLRDYEALVVGAQGALWATEGFGERFAAAA